jgi:hypothetical protein
MSLIRKEEVSPIRQEPGETVRVVVVRAKLRGCDECTPVRRIRRHAIERAGKVQGKNNNVLRAPGASTIAIDASASFKTRPSATSTRLSSPSAKQAIERLSGDQK